MKVEFVDDILGRYNAIFKGEYEKANIWPEFRDYVDFWDILTEEINEAHCKCNELDSYLANCSRAYKSVEYIKGYAVGAICELLQVLAVCYKLDGNPFAVEEEPEEPTVLDVIYAARDKERE